MGKTILLGLMTFCSIITSFCANAKRCVNLSAQNGYCFVFGILFSAAPKQLRTKSLVKLCCSVSF